MSQMFYLSCKDSLRYFKFNSPSSFKVALPSYREFVGLWECGVVSINLSFKGIKTKNIFLCCDLATNSYVRDRELPVLRSIPTFGNKWTSFDFSNIIYVPMSADQVNQIAVTVLDDNLKQIEFIDHNLSCVIHCRLCETKT